MVKTGESSYDREEFQFFFTNFFPKNQQFNKDKIDINPFYKLKLIFGLNR